MKYAQVGKIAMAGLTALAIAVAGVAIAVVTSEVREKARLTIENGATADIELELRIRDAGSDKELRGRARVEGLPIPIQSSSGDRFSLCVGNVFIEDEEVDENGALDISDQIDQGFSFTTLVGQTVSIVNMGTGQDTCTGTTTLEQMVVQSDLE